MNLHLAPVPRPIRRARPLLFTAGTALCAGCFSIGTSLGLSLEELQVELDDGHTGSMRGFRVKTDQAGRWGSASFRGDLLHVRLYNFPFGSKVSLAGVERLVEDHEVSFDVPLPPSGADAAVRAWLDRRTPELEPKVPLEVELVVVSRFGKRVAAKFPEVPFGPFEGGWATQLRASQGKPLSFGARDSQPAARTVGVVVVQTKPEGQQGFDGHVLSLHGAARSLADTRWVAYEAWIPRAYECGSYEIAERSGWPGRTTQLVLTLRDSRYEVYERSTGRKVDDFTVAAAPSCPAVFKVNAPTVRAVRSEEAGSAFDFRMASW